MRLRSLLLGSAAGLMAATAAGAADIPVEIPPAVDYVRVCDTFGAGFFYIPGTETCFGTSGRVRFGLTFISDLPTDDDNDGITETDSAAGWFADGRIGFDVRTATEWGTLRSFLRVDAGTLNVLGVSNNVPIVDPITNETLANGGVVTLFGSRGVDLDQLFVQLGYLTVGYADDLYNGDILYGETSFAQQIGDQSRLQVTVVVDDIGGGFYLGGSISDTDNQRLVRANIQPDDGDMRFEASAGIIGQPWGGIDLSFLYAPNFSNREIVNAILVNNREDNDLWSVKLTGNLSLLEALDARLTVAYQSLNDDIWIVGAALKYGVWDTLDVYGGLRYDFGDNDALAANLGLDYLVASGLTLTAEMTYTDIDDNPIGTDDNFTGLLMLTRTW